MTRFFVAGWTGEPVVKQAASTGYLSYSTKEWFCRKTVYFILVF